MYQLMNLTCLASDNGIGPSVQTSTLINVERTLLLLPDYVFNPLRSFNDFFPHSFSKVKIIYFKSFEMHCDN